MDRRGGAPVYEVDRDPDPFRYVLGWMRSSRLSSAVASDKRLLDDLVVEPTFYALDDLVAAVQAALVSLQRAAEPLHAFSITCGAGMMRNRGDDVQQSLVLQAPHEYCFVVSATGATNQFHLPHASTTS